MEAAAFALIVIVGLVGFGLVALTFMLRRTAHGAYPSGRLAGHWLLDDGFENMLPPPPERLGGKDLDKRVAFKLTRLAPERRAEFAAAWLELERRFPEDPAETTRAAHTLALEVMRARGYPVSDHPVFEPSEHAGENVAELAQTMQRYRTLLEAMIDLPARVSRVN